MSIPEDVFENTSDELCAVIENVLADEAVDQPATLADVHRAVLAKARSMTAALNRFSPDQWQRLCEEIESLVDEYGEDALAVRFVKLWASEPLQRLIEAGLDEIGEPTLEALFDATERGLLAHLIGQGEIDDDEAQTVVAELSGLIARHGPDALAEEFLGAP